MPVENRSDHAPQESTQACNSYAATRPSTRVSPRHTDSDPTDPSGSGGSPPSGNRADTYAAVRVGRPRYVPAMVTYMLSEGATGWVLYDDEGRTAVLPGDGEPMLEAAAVMRENGDPVAGWWSAVLDAAVPTYRFTPKREDGDPEAEGWWSDVFDAEEPTYRLTPE